MSHSRLSLVAAFAAAIEVAALGPAPAAGWRRYRLDWKDGRLRLGSDGAEACDETRCRRDAP